MSAPESAVALRDRILSGDVSAAEVCRDAFARIDAHDAGIHAFQSLMRERAMARADAIDRDPTQFTGRALAGVPVLGLYFAWWIQNDPGPAPPAFRDHKTSDAEVFRRWLPVFKQRRGAKQARELAALVRKTKDEE